MKKDRNCNMNNGVNMGMPYPVYPPYMINPYEQGMMMGGAIQGTPNINMGVSEDQINNLEQQITLLDRRITRLENSINDNKINQYQTSGYSDSYHMM